MEFVKNTLENSAMIYVIDKTAIPDYINTDQSFLSRNTKRGFLYYLANEGIDQIIDGHSNLERMDLMDALDETFFYTLSSAVIESSGIANIVDGVIPNNIVNTDLKNALTTGILLSGTKMVGKEVEKSDNYKWVKHITDKFKVWTN
jgi:hypothetical protein